MPAEALENQIRKHSSEIRTDSYTISIGELMSMYADGELNLHPEFQRFFRWSPLQKSSLIESILLGIPLPSIFVAQRQDDGVLEVVDGMQRLSTIFEFAGDLRDETGAVRPASELVKTRFLTELDGMSWDGRSPLSQAQRLQIKRARMQMTTLDRLSDADTKYELFQRLNTGGTHLSDQEVRNCVMIMIDRSFFKWMEDLSQEQAFSDCISVTERKLSERYELELVLRFLLMTIERGGEPLEVGDVNEFLTDGAIALSSSTVDEREAMANRFRRTFTVINRALGEAAFAPWNDRRQSFTGQFSVAAFETLSVGVAASLDVWEKVEDDERLRVELETGLREMWKSSDWGRRTGSGIRGEIRMPHVQAFGISHFGSRFEDSND